MEEREAIEWLREREAVVSFARRFLVDISFSGVAVRGETFLGAVERARREAAIQSAAMDQYLPADQGVLFQKTEGD